MSLHHGIFGFTCSTMVYKLRHEEEIEIQKIYREIEKDFIVKLKCEDKKGM